MHGGRDRRFDRCRLGRPRSRPVPGDARLGTWDAITLDGNRTEGTTAAQWQRNTDVNSYWTVRLGPFANGDRVTYTVHGSSGDGAVQTDAFGVRIRPALHIAWLWHQHQPLYRDPAAPEASGSYRYPWVRLHAIRDYYSMAALAAEHDVHVTFNLTPVLLRQIDDYLQSGATDSALDRTRHPAEKLTKAQVEEVLSTFFDADWHHQIYIHPRYRELFERRTAGARFSRQDIRDLQMWFNLASFGHEFRAGDVKLITDETVSVYRFVEQQRGFSHDDVLAMVDEQYKILRAVVPIHRELQQSGGIEISTTPAFHPILPLLINTDHAYVDRPGMSLPTQYAHPDDASAQVALACSDYLTRFGRKPAGMWPAEGAVSAEAVDMMGRHGITWIATDAGVLARSGQWGYRASEPDVLLFAAEGSDWFWWFGSDQESRNDAAFDELFRAHLRGAYQELDFEAPESLDDFIVAHPVVWTFTRPVTRIRRRDHVFIRTNCPGRLTYQSPIR